MKTIFQVAIRNNEKSEILAKTSENSALKEKEKAAGKDFSGEEEEKEDIFG